MGLAIFEPEIFNHIPSNMEYDIGGELIPDIVHKKLNVHGVDIPYEWVDIGNVNDFYNATCLILNGKINNYNIFAKEIKKGIFVGLNANINFDEVTIVPPVFIGSSTVVENGAIIIGPVVISSNCHIQKNVFLQECIIDDYKRIHPLAKIKNKILSASNIISFDETVVNIEQSDINWLIEDRRAKHVKTSLEIRLNDIVKKEAL